MFLRKPKINTRISFLPFWHIKIYKKEKNDKLVKWNLSWTRTLFIWILINTVQPVTIAEIDLESQGKLKTRAFLVLAANQYSNARSKIEYISPAALKTLKLLMGT